MKTDTNELPSLSIYLQSQGVDSNTPIKKIEELKKAYWKSYHKFYYQKRKEGHHRFTMRLTKSEFETFTHYAEGHDFKSLSSFIKASALAYLEQQYIPRNQDKVDELSKGIRKISNNVNQVVQSIHRRTKYNGMSGKINERDEFVALNNDYKKLVTKVEQLRKEVTTFMNSSSGRVGDTLWEILSTEPEKINDVRMLLHDIEKKVLKEK